MANTGNAGSQLEASVAEDDIFIKSMASTDSYGKLPLSGVQGSTLNLSCAHVNSPPLDFMKGYSGKKFKTHESSQSTCSKVPAIGYTGSHKGKIHGKIGRIELHRKSIAEEEAEEEDVAVSRKTYKHFNAESRDESFNENAHTLQNYETSSKQAVARGHSVERILADITTKLELKYAGRMQRHLIVRNMFALHDPTGTELCTVENFYQALLSLGIMLPNVEFEALCSEFDEQRSQQISWVKFMNNIGANSTRGSGSKHVTSRLF